MNPFPGPIAPAAPRPPGPSLRASLIVMGLGLLVGIPSFILAVWPLVGAFSSPTYSVPGEVQLHLHHARYSVYERTGTRSGLGGITTRDSSPVTIDASQVSVIAADGSNVPVFDDDLYETVTRGSASFTGAVRFKTPAAGIYTVRLATNRTTTVVIARSIGDVITSVLPWIGTAGIGGLVLLTGGILLIVGATRRGRVRRAMYPGWGSPPQWGPPPYGPGPPPQYPQYPQYPPP